MKVSIITACYNSESEIENTLRSVQFQTYDDIEYIIIDGASSDRTLEIIDKYREITTKVISEPDSGVYNAMNKGINNSAGDLVFFLNAGDVFINETVVEKFANFAREKEAGILLGSILMLNRHTGENYFEKQEYIDKIQLIKKTVYHPATFFRSEVFEKYGKYNEELKIAADYEWYVNYFQNGGNYSYLDTPVSIFDLGDGLSSNAKTIEAHQQERQQILKKYFSQKELNQVRFLEKHFPRKINKHSFRKLLAKFSLNKFYQAV